MAKIKGQILQVGHSGKFYEAYLEMLADAGLGVSGVSLNDVAKEIREIEQQVKRDWVGVMDELEGDLEEMDLVATVHPTDVFTDKPANTTSSSSMFFADNKGSQVVFGIVLRVDVKETKKYHPDVVTIEELVIDVLKKNGIR